MNVVKKASIIAVTVLVIAFSLFLPYISSLTVDHHLGTQIKIMGSNNISLSMSDNIEIIDGAKWFYRPVDMKDEISVESGSVGYDSSSMIELSEYSNLCRLSREDALAAAYETIKELRADVIISEKPTEAVPNLLLSSGEEVTTKTAIYWRCLWIDDNAEAYAAVWIDDKSGQMVSMMMEYTEDFGDEIPEIVYDLGKYCLVHYKAKQIQCRKESDEYYWIDVTVSNNGEETTSSFMVRWQNKELIFFNN